MVQTLVLTGARTDIIVKADVKDLKAMRKLYRAFLALTDKPTRRVSIKAMGVFRDLKGELVFATNGYVLVSAFGTQRLTARIDGEWIDIKPTEPFAVMFYV